MQTYTYVNTLIVSKTLNQCCGSYTSHIERIAWNTAKYNVYRISGYQKITGLIHTTCLKTLCFTMLKYTEKEKKHF